MAEPKPPAKLPDQLAAIAIVAVVLVVVVGFIRLALAHWGYTILIAVVGCAAYYIYSQVKAQK
jgi:hypothetical protein